MHLYTVGLRIFLVHVPLLNGLSQCIHKDVSNAVEDKHSHIKCFPNVQTSCLDGPDFGKARVASLPGKQTGGILLVTDAAKTFLWRRIHTI